MKILFIHADFMEYSVTEKAMDAAEEIQQKSDRMEDVLVAFISVEKDDVSPEHAVEEIKKVAAMLTTTNIMLYPYAHLSSELAPPEQAMELLTSIEDALKDAYTVKRSPFGWYKSFRISCKGHPLSELSRHIVCTPPEEAREEVQSSWYIATPEGELVAAEAFDFTGHEELRAFYEYEAFGSRKADAEPAHVALMREHELVDYEEGSDYGNMRWYPKGYLIKRLLEEKVEELCLDIGAMEVETPIMYDLNHPALSKYVKKFPARQYRIKADKGKEMFLRFAACFGQFLIAHDMVMSYRNLPIRLFELARSFRKEQHGEVTGIKRLRAFTMPDMHTLCMDEAQAIEEFRRQFSLSIEWARLIEIDGEIALRFVKEFFDNNREFAMELVRQWGKPVLVEMWDKRYFYFVMKFEINMNDSVGKTFALSTVQIDVENPQSFGIQYVDEHNNRHHPLLLHTSVSGGIDRCVCALLEKEALKMKKGEKGSFPFWLAPTQIRLIPMGGEYLDYCMDIARNLPARVDIDDRDVSVSKKIREAEKEWIPIIMVVGEKEKEGVFQPRYRFPCEKTEVTLEQLQQMVAERMEGRPFRKLPLPVLLSTRPKFK